MLLQFFMQHTRFNSTASVTHRQTGPLHCWGSEHKQQHRPHSRSPAKTRRASAYISLCYPDLQPPIYNCKTKHTRNNVFFSRLNQLSTVSTSELRTFFIKLNAWIFYSEPHVTRVFNVLKLTSLQQTLRSCEPFLFMCSFVCGEAEAVKTSSQFRLFNVLSCLSDVRVNI